EDQLNNTIKELKLAKNINELILEGSSDYIYQLDVVNNVCTFSSKATDVLDLETPTFGNAMNRLLEFIVPEDRRVFLESYTPFLTGQSKYHTAEYRVYTKTGDIMWISCRGRGMHDENGNPLLIAGSLMDITESKKNDEKIHNMLYYDDLTGLKNKLSFTQDMEEVLANPNEKGSIIFININKLKALNEMFGHRFSNKVLKTFADMLMLYFYDAKGVYHINESEFMIRLDKTSKMEVNIMLAPILNVLSKECTVDNHDLFLELNIAVLFYPDHGKTVDDLINNANQLMYQLSRVGSHEVAFYDSYSGTDDAAKFFLEAELRKEVNDSFSHFRLVYQPIIKEVDGKTHWVGAEALLRYFNPVNPNVKHMDMIMALEYSGLMIPVGRWVIKQAVKACAKWRLRVPNAFVNVNLAAQQITDTHLIEYIIVTCDEAGLPYNALNLEITETSIVKNFDSAIQFCKMLRDKGFGVALDDFGVGYSGFAYLRDLHLSEIKIDLSFIRNIHLNEFNQSVIKFVREISKQKKLTICAEGVEVIEELEKVREFEIDYIQGYYFEKPIEADVFEKLYPSKAL
ncbi:MAG: GGDEF and EAL domain-containing protein, partial [Clostridia bacterium]|nr:GGDEF and EAL domain-containing protein [Clostridia bacterium]